MKIKLIIAVTLALLMVLTFAACNKDNTPNTDQNVTDDTTPVADDTNPDGTTTPVENVSLNIVENGATEYRVVRPENCAEAVTNAAMDLRKALMSKYSISKLTLATDFETPNTDPATRYPYEILVGFTNRDETASAIETIKYNDFIITVYGTRAVITGGNDEKTVEAVNYFIDNMLTDGSLTLTTQDTYRQQSSYEHENTTVMGVKLSDYTIVYGISHKSIAQAVADGLGKYCGAIINVVGDNTDATAHEIIIGSSKRGNARTYVTDYDYSITTQDGKIYVDGNTSSALGAGCGKLISLIKQAENNDISAQSIQTNYTLPDREDYIKDIFLLEMSWSVYMDTPDWMLDFEEKTAAMRDPDSRLMSCLHRGDMVYYPENSIEGIISAIQMGGDMIEIDPRLTKDGVLVLLHDETLTRTTNFSEMAGKNGLPTSPAVEDWTYEQLCQLNLKEKNGGSGTKVTPYKIPTLDEAFEVAANRIFIRLDVKGDSTHSICWNYEKDIWPLMQKHQSYTNVIYTWHSAFYSSSYKLVKTYKALQVAACGDSAFCFVGMNTDSGSAASALATIKDHGLDYCVRLTNCDFSDISATDFINRYSTQLSALKGQARMYIDAHGAGSKYETELDWEKLDDAGINLLLVNKGFSLCQYISKNYQPTQK